MKKKKKSNTLLYIILGAVGVGAWLLFSSFKGAETPKLDENNTPGTEPPPGEGFDCVNDPACLLGYWKWKIVRDKEWFDSVRTKAIINITTYSKQLSEDAQYVITQGNQAETDIAQWISLVEAKMATYTDSSETVRRQKAIDAIILELIRQAVYRNIMLMQSAIVTNKPTEGFSGYPNLL